MVQQHILECRKRIKRAQDKAHSAGSVVLVAVTKNVPVEHIFQALDAGILAVGENRIQETLTRYSAVQDYAAQKGLQLRWHMIGHLQTNKASEAVRFFDLIHSIDSLKLAKEIDKQAGRLNKIQDVLLQVNVSGEKTKFGFSPGDLAVCEKDVLDLKNLCVRGLMTMAPWSRDPEKARPVFKELRLLRDQTVQRTGHLLDVLSMGMSDDFETAVEEGATMVRLGRAIFGDRT